MDKRPQKKGALCVDLSPNRLRGISTLTSPSGADGIDARLLRALTEDPRATTLGLAERVSVSRNTVQARLNKWANSEVLLNFDRRINAAYLGYPLTAYVMTRVKQRSLDAVSKSLSEIPEVVEVHGLSGIADLMIQVVARDADDLYRVAGRILDIKGVRRTSTSLVMRRLITFRTAQLIPDDH